MLAGTRGISIMGNAVSSCDDGPRARRVCQAVLQKERQDSPGPSDTRGCHRHTRGKELSKCPSTPRGTTRRTCVALVLSKRGWALPQPQSRQSLLLADAEIRPMASAYMSRSSVSARNKRRLDQGQRVFPQHYCMHSLLLQKKSDKEDLALLGAKIPSVILSNKQLLHGCAKRFNAQE